MRMISPSSTTSNGPELVKERVLVMDFCAGFAIKDVRQLDARGVDRELLLSRVCEAWAVQMHTAGVFNADPHAGNILVSTAAGDDGAVPVLLDFGLTKRLTPALKLAFARLVHASHESNVDALLQSFEEMGLVLNRYDPFTDMAAMRRSFADTVPASEAKTRSRARAAEWRAEQDARREEEAVPRGQKLRSPVDAWPSEVLGLRGRECRAVTEGGMAVVHNMPCHGEGGVARSSRESAVSRKGAWRSFITCRATEGGVARSSRESAVSRRWGRHARRERVPCHGSGHGGRPQNAVPQKETSRARRELARHRRRLACIRVGATRHGVGV